DAGGKNPVINYTENGKATFSDTTDDAGAVLYRIEYGRAAHNKPATAWYDGHNYFHLYWSEPVSIGSNGALSSANPTAENLRSETNLGDVDFRGGDIRNVVWPNPADGDDVLVEGFFTYSDNDTDNGPIERGSRSGSVSSNSLYRTDSESPGAFDNSDQELRIYLSGYNEGVAEADEEFPGWHAEVPDPASLGAGTIDVLPNSNIVDDQGNEVDFQIDPTGFTPDPVGVGPDVEPPDPEPADPWFNFWDVDSPDVATNRDIDPVNYEIITVDSNLSGFVNRLEFHVLDDDGDDGDWDPENDHQPDGDRKRGIRFTTLDYPNDTLGDEAFRVEEEGFTPVTLSGVSYSSGVDNPLFGNVNVQNDPYFALDFDDDVPGNQWSVLTTLWVSYDETEAYITDLAGNLMRSFSERLAIERTPPRIRLALAQAGGDRVYVQFSEPVFGAGDASTPISAATLTIESPGGQSVTEVSVVSRNPDNDGVTEAFLELSDSLSPNDVVEAVIRPADSTSLYDAIGNPASEDARRRVSDVGLGVVEPVWASDTIHVDDTFGSGFEAVRRFDGSGRLAARDITLQARILASNAAGLPLSLIYDLDVPDSARQNLVSQSENPPFWYITDIPGVVETTLNEEARVLRPYETNGALRDFFIPETDPELKRGSQLEFQFQLGTLPAARSTSANDPREFAPWLVAIEGFVPQRGGVTVLNNVINPEAGERTVLTYELGRPGMVLIQVFTLDGNLVTTLQRGRQGEGSYNIPWDGTNAGGRNVTPGIYFVRVVAPGIDEYRKVMVVD
ncbi:MAG: FlgD immunoglobulin-like domain containing protein, partial [Spirochaetaceae bacterium]